MLHEGMGGIKHEAGVPSKTLTLTGLNGGTKTLDGSKAMPHVTMTLSNGHSHTRRRIAECRSRCCWLAVAMRLAGSAPKVSPRMAEVIAGATDHFHVALTLCDTDPGCRSGQAIVADAEGGKPLATDGAFKLILTDNKVPGRWVRDLSALMEKSLEAR